MKIARGRSYTVETSGAVKTINNSEDVGGNAGTLLFHRRQQRTDSEEHCRVLMFAIRGQPGCIFHPFLVNVNLSKTRNFASNIRALKFIN